MSVVSLAQWGHARRVVTPPTWLVCLNLRNRYITAGHPLCVPDANKLVPRISQALAFARAHKWRIVHVANRPEIGFGAEARELNGSVPGLEPKIDEPVYQKSGPSVFTAFEMLEHARGVGPAEIVVTGLAPALDWIATALDARDLGWPLRIVSDGMGIPASCDQSSDASRTTLSGLLAPIADVVPLESALRGLDGNGF